MGYADRDYYRQEVQRPPSRLAGAPVVKWLLIINAVVFLLTLFGRGNDPPTDSALDRFGWFSIAEGLQQFQVWRLFTFQFLHADFIHILFNMYALYMFGPILEQWWRSRPFLLFYLLSGIAGALFFVLIWAIPGFLDGVSAQTPLVGASAGIFGILIGVAVIAPEGRIMLLFPPIPMKMRTFAIVILAFGLFAVLANSKNAGGEAGHLGGALAGFLMMKVGPLREFLMRLGSGQVIIVKRPSKPRRRFPSRVRPASSSVSSSEAGEIDRILDKINAEGLHSLTEEERKLLNKAAGDE